MMPQSVMSVEQVKKLIATATNPRAKKQYQKILDKLTAVQEKQKEQKKEAKKGTSALLAPPPRNNSRAEGEKKPSTSEAKLCPPPKAEELESSIDPNKAAAIEQTPTSIEQTPSAETKEKTTRQPGNQKPDPHSKRSKEKRIGRRIKGNPDKQYKAVGVIEGIVELDEGIHIYIGDERFKVAFDRKNYAANYYALCTDLKQHGGKGQYKIFCYAQLGKQINFVAIAFQREGGKEMTVDIPLGHFKLCGAWKKIVQRDVVCVFRNRTPELFETLKRMTPQEQKRYTKPQNFTVIWDDPPLPPFTSIDDGELHFVEVMTKFDPVANNFEVVELLDEPTMYLPHYQRYLDKPLQIQKEAKKKKGKGKKGSPSSIDKKTIKKPRKKAILKGPPVARVAV